MEQDSVQERMALTAPAETAPAVQPRVSLSRYRLFARRRRDHLGRSAVPAKHRLAIDDGYHDGGGYEQNRIVWRSIGKNGIVQLPVK